MTAATITGPYGSKVTPHELWRARADRWRYLPRDVKAAIRAGTADAEIPATDAVRAALAMWRKLDSIIERECPTSVVKRRRKLRAVRRKLQAERDRCVDSGQTARANWLLEELADIDWQLSRVAIEPAKVKYASPMQDWRTSEDIRLAKRWRKRYGEQLSAMGFDRTQERAELLQTLEQLNDKIKRLELEDYDLRLSAWRALQMNGTPPGRLPRRPNWLAEEENTSAKADRERRKVVQAARRADKSDCHEQYIQTRRADRALERSRLEAARKANHLDALRRKLLDWVRDMRAWGAGLPVETEDGRRWTYFEDREIPHHDARQHVLRACAVRLSTGWAFEVLGD